MIIYLIRNLATGKGYVGQTVKDIKTRWACHRSSAKPGNKRHGCVYLQNAMRKYSIENFQVSVLEQCRTLEDLNVREAWWIASLKTIAPNGYNIRPGGGNAPMSEETKRKLSEAHKGRPGTKWTEEHRVAHAANMTGRKKSPEQCAAISARMTANNPMRGKNISEEHREKLSKAGKGRKQNPEWVARRMAKMIVTRLKNGWSMAGIRNPMFGRRQKPETIAKIKANRKPPVLTPELRAKYSAASKRRQNFHLTPETRLKMSLAASRPKPWKKGKPLSEATRIGYIKFCDAGGKPGSANPMFGRKHSEETRRKMSEVRRNKFLERRNRVVTNLA